jgi:hypothetical protein
LLGNFRFTTDDDLNPDTGVAKHGDQGIDTEAVDLASDKVADPWLGHAEQACGLSLGETPSLNQLAEPNHQICPDLEILSLFVWESEVPEYVPAGASNFDRHRASFFF